MGGVVLGTVYRVGPGGVRVVFRDGSVENYPAYALVTFDRRPFRIEGPLVRVGRRQRVRVTPTRQYETKAP